LSKDHSLYKCVYFNVHIMISYIRQCVYVTMFCIKTKKLCHDFNLSGDEDLDGDLSLWGT
jgi:hypothetical protein